MEAGTAQTLFWGITPIELITVIAIIVGPILAVAITRFQDRREKRQQRKLEIFRSLMQTRRTTLDRDHVGALNLVEVEFHGQEKIKTAYRRYMEFRHEPIPSSIDIDDQDRHFQRGENLLFDLLHEIGSELGYKFDKDDLKRFAYIPKGWNDDEALGRKNALLLSQLLEGKIALPVTPQQPQENSPFPPAPIDDKKT